MKDELNPGIKILFGSFFILIGLGVTSTLLQLISLEYHFEGSILLKCILAGVAILLYTTGICLIYRPLGEYIKSIA